MCIQLAAAHGNALGACVCVGWGGVHACVYKRKEANSAVV